MPSFQPSSDPQITHLLQQMSAGDATAESEVWTHLRAALHERAARVRGQQAPDFSLQTTELLGLAYERVKRQGGKVWKDRLHFLRFAAMAMRSALIDHVRSRKNTTESLPLDEFVEDIRGRVSDVGSFYEAVERFETTDPVMAEALKLRAEGFSAADIAEMLGIHRRTFDRQFDRARGQIRRLME